MFGDSVKETIGSILNFNWNSKQRYRIRLTINTSRGRSKTDLILSPVDIGETQYIGTFGCNSILFIGYWNLLSQRFHPKSPLWKLNQLKNWYCNFAAECLGKLRKRHFPCWSIHALHSSAILWAAVLGCSGYYPRLWWGNLEFDEYGLAFLKTGSRRSLREMTKWSRYQR